MQKLTMTAGAMTRFPHFVATLGSLPGRSSLQPTASTPGGFEALPVHKRIQDELVLWRFDSWPRMAKIYAPSR